MSYKSEDIRNVAVVGHSGCGKTTLIECLLHHTGMTTRVGKVSEGTSVLDVAPDEKDRGGTIDSALAHIDHEGLHINLIDTPGLLDFISESAGAFNAVETALFCVDAKAGAKVATRKLWKLAGQYDMPRVIAVTRIDQQDASFPDTLAALKELWGKRCIALFLPDESGPGVSSLVEVLDAGDDASAELKEARERLVEAIVETDEGLLERYLMEEEIRTEELVKTARRAVMNGQLYPVLPIAAEKGIGLDFLLRGFKSFFPGPVMRAHQVVAKGGRGAGAEGEDRPAPHAHDATSSTVTGLVFKIAWTDAGKVSFVRVMSGELSSGKALHNVSRGGTERSPHLFKGQGKDRKPMDKAIAGDICLIPKADSLHIGDTVSDAEDFGEEFVTLDPPKPMVKLAIEPKSRADASKLLSSLRRLEEECPTFQTEKHEVTGDLLVKGSSRTHLDIMLARLQARSRIEVDTSPPTIAYRETITAKGDARYRHKKQSGGSGEFGEVALRIEPLERDAGFEFVSKVVGGAISQSYLPSIEKGIKELMARGVIAGFPMRDVRVVVYDGKEHSVDSKDVAFQKAGRGAFKEAVEQARPILLEPLCHLELHVPTDHQGEVQGDLASTRRGQITGTTYEGNETVITAVVPEAEMIGYDAQLRSMTAGEGSFTLEPAAYGNVPGNIQEQIVSEFASKGSEDD